jgi:hypothetical protein
MLLCLLYAYPALPEGEASFSPVVALNNLYRRLGLSYHFHGTQRAIRTERILSSSLHLEPEINGLP